METTEKNMEHGEHFNESIVNEVILEDMKKNRIDHMKYLPGMEVLEESDVMDQVISAMNAYDYDKYTEADVRRALAHDNRTPEDFQALLSPAALPLLEEIAQAAQKETRKHFGNSVAGTCTDPPALAYANSLCSKEAPAVGYSTVYPLSMFLRIFTAQIIVLFFCGL